MSVLKIKNDKGQWISITTIKGDNGKSPYFDENDGRWYEWNDDLKSYVPSAFDGKQGISDPATEDTLGAIKVGDGLKITSDGVLSVDTVSDVEQDNTKPISSGAVYREIGNIEVLLGTI